MEKNTCGNILVIKPIPIVRHDYIGFAEDLMEHTDDMEVIRGVPLEAGRIV
jgi:hypothetical protein